MKSSAAAKKPASRAKSGKRATAKPAAFGGSSDTFVAKVFRSGNSQAIRIPATVKLTAKSYLVEPTGGGGLRFIDPAFEARRLKALQALRGSAPDFPDHTT